MLQKISSVFVVYRRKPLTGSPDPTHAIGTDKPCKSDKSIGAIRSIYVTLTIIIVSFGFVGNALILIVMCNKAFNKTSTSVYLSALAVSDSLMLFAGPLSVNVFRTNMSLKIDLRTIHLSICWILKILIYWARYFSSFCLASITVERLIVILKPHK